MDPAARHDTPHSGTPAGRELPAVTKTGTTHNRSNTQSHGIGLCPARSAHGVLPAGSAGGAGWLHAAESLPPLGWAGRPPCLGLQLTCPSAYRDP